MEKQWEKKIYPFKKTTKKKYQVQSLEKAWNFPSI